MNVTLFEQSHRVGGRIKTFREFPEDLHGEGGAMRLPKNHRLVREYLDIFQLTGRLESFVQKYAAIYLVGLGSVISYEQFEAKLKSGDADILRIFPDLGSQVGKTLDVLWTQAIQKAVRTYAVEKRRLIGNGASVSEAKQGAWERVEVRFGDLTLQGYLEHEAGWSDDAIRLYDLGNAHVVLSNGFTESLKDAYLSSQEAGGLAGMQQLKGGMDTLPLAFVHPPDGFGLSENIQFGTSVRGVMRTGAGIRVEFHTPSGEICSQDGDYVVFAVPFPVLNMLGVDPPFSTGKRTAIRTLRYVEVTKVLLQFRERWWESKLTELTGKPDGALLTDLPIRYAVFPTCDPGQRQGTGRGVVMASYTFEQDAMVWACLSDADRIRLSHARSGNGFRAFHS